MVSASNLTRAAQAAVDLSAILEQQPVLAGALAMASHGYARETQDVDIVMASDASIDEIVDAADEIGLTVKARHSFGGVDLRSPSGEFRIDVLSFTDDLRSLTDEAVEEAVKSDRKDVVFGQEFYVVSLGHLVALKLAASRRKDIGDLVELIKVLMEKARWEEERQEIVGTVRRHLGWYASTVTLNRLAEDAAYELGRS